MMRIVGGALKNKRLKTPIGFYVRPTSEKVREALFDILGLRIEEARFLDLFAGSGAVGIEAASRGAIKVTYVEAKASVLRVLRQNIESCQILDMSTIIHFDVFGTIRSLNNRQRFFDIIFIDPPYEGTMVHETLLLMSKHPIMNKDSIIVTQSFFKTSVPSVPGFKRNRQDKYGETLLTFYSWEGE